jgi:hypothetical protein
MFKVQVYIQGERLDLFDDENISVVSSVQNIDDISRNFNDFSQDFTVPATPNNNRIFKHWYNFNITGGFDARVRHKAHIDIQSANFKVGSILLQDCKVEDNKPAHYKLTFYGQLIDLKKVMADEYLDKLDLASFDIDYTPENIKTALTTGFQTKDYIVPLIGTKRQWFYDSNVTTITYTEKLSNIAWNGSAVAHGIDWTSLRPALRVRRIIQEIQNRYGLTFTGGFFDLPVFDDLYLWLANEDTEEAIKNDYKITNYDSFFSWQPAIGSYDNATGEWTANDFYGGLVRSVRLQVWSSDGVLYSIKIMNTDEVLEEISGTGNLELDISVPSGFVGGDKIYAVISSSTDKIIDDCLFRVVELSDDGILLCQKENFTVTGANANVSTFMPKIRVIDFLKSIISAYNLVVVPESENTFYINTLNKWYDEGGIFDLSPYVDTREVTYSRGKIFKEISFKFQEPQTILGEKFMQLNNTAYGDLEIKLNSANGEQLDGEELEIEVDFENMVYERLPNLETNNLTNIVYGLSLDNSLDAVVPEAHIFYAYQKSVSANPISFIDDSGVKTQISGNVFMPSHADAAQNYSTNFGGETNEHTGGINNNSLYKLYYDDYIRDTFSIQRRRVYVIARPPLYLLSTIKLNDKLIMNGDRFIINQMTTNVTTGVVEFELLNDIFNQPSDLVVVEENNSTPPPPPPRVGVSFGMSSTGLPTPSGACGLVPNTNRFWLGMQSYPTLGDYIYTNIGLTAIFNGGGNYFKIANNLVIRVNSNGLVIDVFLCNGGSL